MSLTLKITPHLVNILQLVANNPEVIVSAPTGTGKSLGIPWAVAQTGAKIFISVPTVTAAVSLSETQKKLSPNLAVGYAAESNVRYNETTKIVYATSGHIRRKMLSYINKGICSPINFTDVLMIDEVHTGSADNDIIVALWRYCGTGVSGGSEARGDQTDIVNNSKTQVPRLIYSSATIPPNLTGVIYEVPDKNYPVQIRYYDRDLDIDDQEIYTALTHLIKNYHNSSVEGGFLVFMSGANEVESLIRTLGPLEKALILPAYSTLTGDDISKIYETPIQGIRKIIIATNIAETAITIENIGMVFDSMREKRPEVSLTGGFRLTTSFISKASAIQRAGRTGRTGPGICFRLMTENYYNQNLEANRPSELQSVPIHTIMMELLSVGLKPSQLNLNISSSREEETLKLLRTLKMIDEQGNTTELGKFVTTLPLSVRNSACLYQWLALKYEPFPIIILLSMLDSYGPPYFWFPRRERDQTQLDYNSQLNLAKEEYFEKYRGRSDLHTFLNIWNDLINEIGYIGADVKDYCVKNSLNNKKIREALNIVRQVINRVRNFQGRKLRIDVGTIDVEATINNLRPILTECYSDLILDYLPSRVETRLTYVHPETSTVYTLDTQRTVNELSFLKPKQIIGLITAEIRSGMNSFNVINIAVDLSQNPFIPSQSEQKLIVTIKRKPRDQIQETEPNLIDEIGDNNIVVLSPIIPPNESGIVGAVEGASRGRGLSSLEILGETTNLPPQLGRTAEFEERSSGDQEFDKMVSLVPVIRSRVEYISVN